MIYPGSYSAGFAPRDFTPAYPSLWNGCVAAWASTLGPTGATLFDWSPYKNHGTLTSLTLDNFWAAKRGNYNGVLDGTSGHYINAGNNASLQVATNISIVAWISAASSPGTFKYLLGKTDAGTKGYAMYTGAGGGLSGYIGRSGGLVVVPLTTSPWDGTDVCVCMTADATDLRMYRNGALNCTPGATTTALAADASASLWLGGAGSTNGTGLEIACDFSLIAIYNRVLTGNEIVQHALRPGIMFEAERYSRFVPAAGGVTGGPFPFFTNRTMVGGMLTPRGGAI